MGERKIEVCHSPLDNDEPMHDETNIQVSVDSQSYGEQSALYESNNIQSERDNEIAKAREILRRTDEVMISKPSDPRQEDATSTNCPSRCMTVQKRNAA